MQSTATAAGFAPAMKSRMICMRQLPLTRPSLACPPNCQISARELGNVRATSVASRGGVTGSCLPLSNNVGTETFTGSRNRGSIGA